MTPPLTLVQQHPRLSRLLPTLLWLLLPLLGWGQAFTGTYQFTDVAQGAGGTTDPTAVPIATGVNFGAFSAVGTPANPNAGGRFSFANWPTGAIDGSNVFTGAINTGEYYSVTLAPQAGFVLSVSSATFTLQRTGTGIRQYAVRSSADNYATNLPASIAPATAALSVVAGNIFQVADASASAQVGSTITVSGAGYTNVSGPVTFRFYGFNAEAASGTFSIDDVKFTGTATATNAPTISSFTPDSGPVGTSVTITGTYFTRSSTVAFNGVAAPNVTYTNATTLVAVVPSGATSGPLTVATSGGTATSTTAFTVTVPTVTVSPTALTGFAAAAGTASAAQTYQVSGSALNGTSLTITPTNTNFEVSLDGSSYGPSASIALGGSPTLAATTVYVRLASGAPIGTVNGTIANTNGAVTTNLTVSGAVVAPLVAKRWTGAAGTTSWFDAANWEGGTLPASADDVVLDHRYVAAKYTVSLSSGSQTAQSATTVSSLRLRPQAGDSILFDIPPTNTLAAALTISRSATGDTAIYIGNRGFLSQRSGATENGSVPLDVAGTNPTVFILNGGSVRHQSVRGATEYVENLSGAAGTELGNFYYRLPVAGTATISGSGRTYGNLIFQKLPALATANYTASGVSNLTVNGTLTTEVGTVFTSSLTGDVVLKGNLLNNGNLRVTPALNGSGTRQLLLQGTAAQVVAGVALGDPATATSYLATNANLEINNAAGVTLQTPVTLSNVLTLTKGFLTTSATNVLTLMPAATMSAGSENSFVNGPVARPITSVDNATGVYTSYTFPVGKGASYRPITLNISSQSGTTTYRAEQFEGDPGQNTAGSDLTRVSKLRWFTITPFSGTTVAQPSGFAGTISLSYGPTDGITDPSAKTLVLAKRADASQPWANIGRTNITNTSLAGPANSTLTSSVFTSFSDFVLASTDPSATINPLPVTLTSFGALRLPGGAVQVNWATASEQHSAYFEVQRSLDGSTFTTVDKVLASGTTTQTHAYTSRDQVAPASKLHYRLRQVDTDGTETFSPVVILAPTEAAAPLALYPNPAHDQLTIAAAAGLEVQVCDLTGRVLQTTILPTSGKLSMAALPAGTYLLRVSVGGQRRALRFTKD
ncbi:MAG: T9SS type A sorting domain-containing protein [Janthinobacterium lividum]